MRGSAPMELTTKDRLLQAGAALLLERGYNDLGIQTLLEKTAVHEGLDHFLESSTVPPLQRVRNFFEGTVEKYREEGYLGCLLGGLGQEHCLTAIAMRIARCLEQAKAGDGAGQRPLLLAQRAQREGHRRCGDHHVLAAARTHQGDRAHEGEDQEHVSCGRRPPRCGDDIAGAGRSSSQSRAFFPAFASCFASRRACRSSSRRSISRTSGSLQAPKRLRGTPFSSAAQRARASSFAS